MVTKMRHQGDELADTVFSYLKENRDQYEQLFSLSQNKQLKHFSTEEPIGELVDTFKLPKWTNPQLLKEGSDFFRRHAVEVMGVLGLYSLPYCYAGANGVQVLYHSKRIRSEPAKRLTETAQFVLDVCSKNAFDESGCGFLSILKVRLMHAAARHYTQEHIRDETPVNQEDMTGTMLAFSLIVIRGLRKLGIDVSEKDGESYFHLWLVIGFLMGIKYENLPTSVRQGSHLERQIRKREFRYSKEADELTNVLVGYINENDEESNLPFDAQTMMTYFLGDVSECLGLNRISNLESKIIEAGSRLKFGFKEYSESNYTDLLKNFHKDQEKPDFKISY